MKTKDVPIFKQKILDMLPVTQVDMWKKLEIDSREGSYIVNIMLKENLVTRRRKDGSFLLEKSNGNRDVDADIKKDEESDIKEDEESDIKKDIDADIKKDIDADIKKKTDAVKKKADAVKKKADSDIKRDEESDIKKDEESDIKKAVDADIKKKADAVKKKADAVKKKADAVKKKADSDIKKDEESDIKKDEESDIKKDEESDIKKDEDFVAITYDKNIQNIEADSDIKKKVDSDIKKKVDSDIKKKADSDIKKKADSDIKKKADFVATTYDKNIQNVKAEDVNILKQKVLDILPILQADIWKKLDACDCNYLELIDLMVKENLIVRRKEGKFFMLEAVDRDKHRTKTEVSTTISDKHVQKKKSKDVDDLKKEILGMLPIEQSDILGKLDITNRVCSSTINTMIKENLIVRTEKDGNILLEKVNIIGKKHDTDYGAILSSKYRFAPCCGCTLECDAGTCTLLTEWLFE